ncbi:unnamed protein product [Mytilus coruscus]|uniref:C-type lectin domain-containing protein n=1 Tax=Mytilus coruscus TaxID=42192 RepID=A0A6J8BVG8_MYTCO|nr:unnamed protein product [Mytilus coruscus]
MESLGAVKLDHLMNIFQTEGNVGLIQTIGLLQCFLSCLRNQMCLTLFFKNDIKLCILHSKTFYYKQPTKSGVGWEAYQIKDLSGRCPEKFAYYRKLDLCYRIEHGTDDNLSNFGKCVALQSELIRIDSSNRQKYVEHILDGVTRDWICIQGNNFMVHNRMTFDDGTDMVYFNWDSSQPDDDNLPIMIVMAAAYNYTFYWHDMNFPKPLTCSYICEKRA